ncbi:MAG: aminodeoxychorismate synthase component I [Gammaproteobacteria bacterium]|nr:aminodeoxychorismate synthase component I [Gammaproteobacteria bacterium]
MQSPDTHTIRHIGNLSTYFPGATLLQLHHDNKASFPFLLESVAHGTAQARYNILFAYPKQTLELSQQTVLLDGKPQAEHSFLTSLDRLWRDEAKDRITNIKLPFSGGWFVYLGYELAQEIEPTLQLPDSVDGLPVAFATRITAAIIEDIERQQYTLVAESEGELEQLTRACDDALQQAQNLSAKQLAVRLTEEEPSKHHVIVEKAKQYIIDGDIFQANLSRLWQGQLEQDSDSVELYQSLRKHNPAPFAGLAHYQGCDIISSSPERLVEVRDGQAQTRPIAGTRPRRPGDEDKLISDELMQHPKERAEHIMLIDLERNDLGRISKPGSVEVDELMVLESYAHVHHIVSNVKGTLRDDVTPADIIRATFPGGTITGCPKVRCMEIIAELEEKGRGAYTGSMGYLNHNGDMDLNILIRTIVKQDKQLWLRAGGGIVVDSQPEAELNETRAKARGLLHALGIDA